jgi:hypothetical protein
MSEDSMKVRNQIVKAALLLVTLTAIGCGSAAQSMPPTAPEESAAAPPRDIHSLEGEIQVQLGIMAGDGECHDRCRAAASICDSSDQICSIARDLAELEAIESCRRSEDHCSEARRVVDDGCTCPN